MNLEQAEEMTKLAKEEGRFLGCCSVRFKGMPHMEAVKRILSSGKLGEIYHVSFVNKWERSRAGIEYQPTSPWFLDSRKSGGGVLMDWGPYDFTTLNDILDPNSVEINSAFLAKPVTAIDPVNTPFDIETHVGASMTFQCESVPVHVNYERATCTHGRGYVKVEIEGTHGSLHWTPFDSKGPVLYCYDHRGELIEEQVDTGPRSDLTIFDNPLNHFYRKVKGLESHANVDEKALANFRCIRAVYTVAETGQKQIVSIR
jgi:predicted dehydrogenase